MLPKALQVLASEGEVEVPGQTLSLSLSSNIRTIAQPALRSSLAGLKITPYLDMICAIVCWEVDSRLNRLFGSATDILGLAAIPSFLNPISFCSICLQISGRVVSETYSSSMISIFWSLG